MNVAFPALLVLLLALPGVIFRYTYARGAWGWSSPTSFRGISDELANDRVAADDDSADRYYDIRGDYLVVRYAQMRTVNLDYFWLTDDDGVTLPAA